MPGGVKRKSTDPKLLLVQSEALSLSELDSQYRLIVEQTRRESDLTPTFDPSLSTLSSSQCEDLTHHSSSYTSWTKPVQVTLSVSAKLLTVITSFQGRRDSDSCGPNSSILDIFTEQEGPPAPAVSLDEPSISVRERESSADTSKDVSDIESDWDEEEEESWDSQHKVKTNNNSSRNISKRSISRQNEKIKKFSL